MLHLSFDAASSVEAGFLFLQCSILVDLLLIVIYTGKIDCTNLVVGDEAVEYPQAWIHLLTQ